MFDPQKNVGCHLLDHDTLECRRNTVPAVFIAGLLLREIDYPNFLIKFPLYRSRTSRNPSLIPAPSTHYAQKDNFALDITHPSLLYQFYRFFLLVCDRVYCLSF